MIDAKALADAKKAYAVIMSGTATEAELIHADNFIDRLAERCGVPRSEIAEAVEAEAGTIVWNVELTDTFGGEANYSWCRRQTIELPSDASDLAVMRAAKKAVGMNGVRGRTSDYGGSLEFRPFGACVVMFATPRF